MTRKRTGFIPWNKGKPCSEEVKQKISLKLRGNKYALGLRHSEETKEKIRQGIKKYIEIHGHWTTGTRAWNNGQEWPDIVKQNISRGMVVYWKRRKEEQKQLQQQQQ